MVDAADRPSSPKKRGPLKPGFALEERQIIAVADGPETMSAVEVGTGPRESASVDSSVEGACLNAVLPVEVASVEREKV